MMKSVSQPIIRATAVMRVFVFLFTLLSYADTSPVEAQTTLNPCIAIASDSNGFGHVTFQLPNDPAAGDARGRVGIVYIQPLYVVMQRILQESGIQGWTVRDHSMVAASLTATGRTAYQKSDFYGGLFKDRCQYIVVMPFIPDVAAGKANPEQYRIALTEMISGLVSEMRDVTVYVLNFYQTTRAEFTASNSGFGLTPDRIDAFNTALATACKTGAISRIQGVQCLSMQTFFGSLNTPYTLVSATKAQYDLLFYKRTGFTAQIDAYFAANPNGILIGDGIHLNLTGREQLARGLTQLISTQINNAPLTATPKP